MKAAHYNIEEKEIIRCNLCPHNCRIKTGETGICKVRYNSGGMLETRTFNNVSALAVDPVEKKPLYHFYPGHKILSVGSFGCNMRCSFCQNHHISQASAGVMNSRANETDSAEIIREAARLRSNIGIAYTYNEPVIWYEFMLDIAIKAKENQLSNVMISNGFINPEPLDVLLEYIDAFNIDLKAFNDSFYRHYTGASLRPVLSTLEQIKKADKHLEITYLVIPDLNDDYKEFSDCVKWISDTLGKETVIHLSRYFPNYNMAAPLTPESSLKTMYDIACKELNYVYPGNIDLQGIKDTVCPDCSTLITSRSGYRINHINTSDGRCSNCGRVIYINF